MSSPELPLSPSPSSSKAATWAQEELARANERLSTWKEKTKVGVDQLRARIVELTEKVELLEAQRQERQQKSAQDGVVSCDVVSSSTLLPELHHVSKLSDAAVQFCFEKMNCIFDIVGATPVSLGPLPTVKAATTSAMTASFFTGTTPVSSEHEGDTGVASSCHAIAGEFENYKRRTETALRLQTANFEILQRQTEELRASLQKAQSDLAARSTALAGRDATLARLSDQLAAAELARQQLEERQNRGLNMEQADLLEEAAERAVLALRDEYAAREDAVFAQHTDEIQRLVAAHERELATLREEGREAVAQAVREGAAAAATVTPAVCAKVMNGGGRCEDVDEAYVELLREFQAVEQTVRTLQQENTQLKTELRCAATPAQKPGGTGSVSGSNGAEGSATLLEQLQSNNNALTEQLWAAKRELMDVRHHGADKASADAGGMDAQQVMYLKSVVLKMLCAKDRDVIFVSVLPVLSTMLGISGTELATVYQVHPKWITRK